MSKVEIWTGLVNQPGGKYYPDRQWENVFAGQNPLFQASGTFTNLGQRDAYFTTAYATSPGMVVDFIERGAKYPSKKNTDGGVSIYTGPKPPDGLESNWIPTAGKRPLPAMRCYGPTEALNNKTFKLPDFEAIA
jgi:hypothetical protein